MKNLIGIIVALAGAALPMSGVAQQPFPQPSPFPQQQPYQPFQPVQPPQVQMQRRGQIAQPLDIARGQRLYNMHCSSCHGMNGRSVTPNTPNLALREGMDKPDMELSQSLITGVNMRTGKNHNPPFTGVIKEHEMMEIIQYARIIR